MARHGASRAALGVAAAALVLAATLPRAAAVVCVVCPVGFYHVGCDFLTGSSGAPPRRRAAPRTAQDARRSAAQPFERPAAPFGARGR